MFQLFFHPLQHLLLLAFFLLASFSSLGQKSKIQNVTTREKLALQAFVAIGADANPSFLSLTRSLKSQSSVTFSDHSGCSQGNEIEKNPDY